jgi:hypothetical protein
MVPSFCCNELGTGVWHHCQVMTLCTRVASMTVLLLSPVLTTRHDGAFYFLAFFNENS